MNKNLNNNFGLEALEDRTHLSATHHHALGVAVKAVADNIGTRLVINGTAGNDNIQVNKTTNGFQVIANGVATNYNGNYSAIEIHGGAGNDRITVDQNVKTTCLIYGDAGNDTLTAGGGNDRVYGGAGNNVINGGAGNDVLVSIGSAVDIVNGGTGNNSFWADTNDVLNGVRSDEIAGGNVHRVGSFFNYRYSINGQTKTAVVSKDLAGQDLVDPSIPDAGVTYHSFRGGELFSSTGPSANDINQGYVGDCYFLATLAAIAKTNANVIRQSVVDLGDGTFAVQFVNRGVKTFVRVDGDLPTWGWGQLAYANRGAENSLWVAVMEKAFAIFRTGTASYSSINAGWMDEVFSDLGYASTGIFSSSNANTLMTWIKNQLSAGKAVTFAAQSTKDSSIPLIGEHAYTVVSVNTDANGNMTLTLRNPWGIDGAGNDGNDDGYVTVTAAQAQTAFMGAIAAKV